jgi:TRAP-type transport system periplasmic protein
MSTKASMLATVLIPLAFALPRPASSETLTYSTPESPSHATSVNLDQPFMKCVRERSNGSVDFQYFPGGQVAGYKEGVYAVQQRLTDISLLSLGVSAGDLPLHSVTTLPGTAGSPTESLNAYRKAVSAADALTNELRAKKLHALMYNPFPASEIISRGAPIVSVKDFSGKKIRVAGGAFQTVIQSLGAVPVQLAPGDIYLSLQQGAIDATALPISGINSYKLAELIKSVSTNISIAQAGGFVVMNLEKLNSLNDMQKEVLRACAAQAEESMAKFLEDEVAKTLAALESKGVKVYTVPQEELSKIKGSMGSAAEEFLTRIESRAPEARNVYSSLQGYFKDRNNH